MTNKLFDNEKSFDAEDGPSIDGEEFLEMMAERGLIVPRPPTFTERALRAVTSPFRWFRRGVSWIAWKIWGKYLFDRAVKKQIKRMQLLAGVGEESTKYPFMRYASPAPYNGPYDHRLAKQVHDDVIKTKIIKEVLPKPDSDDSGLN